MQVSAPNRQGAEKIAKQLYILVSDIVPVDEAPQQEPQQPQAQQSDTSQRLQNIEYYLSELKTAVGSKVHFPAYPLSGYATMVSISGTVLLIIGLVLIAMGAGFGISTVAQASDKSDELAAIRSNAYLVLSVFSFIWGFLIVSFGALIGLAANTAKAILHIAQRV